MVNIQGRWECVAEYLNRCLGLQAVVDVIQEGDTVYYVFENGHALPLLCFCCDTPLAFKDLEQTRLDMRGRRLESMACPNVTLENGSVALQFRLEFSKKGLLGQGTYTATSLQSAARLRHPLGCPQRKAAPISSRRQRKRQR